MLKCPLKNTKLWKNMVKELGETGAYTAYINNDFDLLEADQLKKVVEEMAEEQEAIDEGLWDYVVEEEVVDDFPVDTFYEENEPRIRGVFGNITNLNQVKELLRSAETHGLYKVDEMLGEQVYNTNYFASQAEAENFNEVEDTYYSHLEKPMFLSPDSEQVKEQIAKFKQKLDFYENTDW